MAWQTSEAWKTSLNKEQKHDDSNFPGLEPTTAGAPTKIEYEELQKNEVLALEAIYGDDFVKHSHTHRAWQKAEPSFEIHIQASTDSELAVTVGFVMTATYPKTPPILTTKGLDNLRETTQFRVQKFIETQPKLFAKDGQEMIDKIVEGIRDILEDVAQAKSQQVPSLEEERERHEATLSRLAQEHKEQEERKRIEEMEEEERAMLRVVRQQLDLQKNRGRPPKLNRRASDINKGHPAGSRVYDDETVEFDQPCDTTDKGGNVLRFQSVAGKYDPREGPVSIVYTVRPVLLIGHSHQHMALKEAILRSNRLSSKHLRQQLRSLESRLQDLMADKKLHNRHIVEILGFKVESGLPGDPEASNSWTVRVLTPMAEQGSLEELLELAGHIEIGKVKSWTRDLLDALQFLHNKTLTHQDIHARNILLFRESTGEIVPKISDAWYQREIHNAITQNQPALSSAKSAYWLPPEIASASRPQYTYKTDIWEFGVVFLQMIFGLDVLRKYSSPKNLMHSLTLSHPLQELVGKFFDEDTRKRPRAFELGSSEFLATDSPVFFDDFSTVLSTTPSGIALQTVQRNSVTRGPLLSRYKEDFMEECRLGKGGFGEVVKARNKLDGQIYAIKKITLRSKASLTEILKEVRLLSQLSHPAVVRYYNTWVEEVPDLTDTQGDTSAEILAEETGGTESAGIDVQFVASTDGLDIMTPSMPDEIESDETDGDDDDDDDDDDYDGDEESFSAEDALGSHATLTDGELAPLQRRGKSQRQYRAILYISMEYCEKRTLRDLICRNLYEDRAEIWRLFRQLLEGLAHIHKLGIVHRDLKPENIFISRGLDDADNVKIGDFGLATSGRFSTDKVASGNLEADDMTRSIGTAYYAAPEVKSSANGIYSTKVDMYSLGIIFFEMCHPPMVGMHKSDVIGQLRRSRPVLPAVSAPDDKEQTLQTEIILALVNHDPKERPSSSDLLKSGKLPVEMESETIKRTIAGMLDPASPYYDQVLTLLFSRPVETAKDYAYDMFADRLSCAELWNRDVIKNALVSIFRRHGALEAPRSSIYPKSPHYGESAVRLLDSNGKLLQLPYDLTMGHARMVAKNAPALPRTFTFGHVFRDRQNTGQPAMFAEVDFDIVSSDTLDLALKEAEVLKVLDEIISTLPFLSGQMCFHVGHSDLLQLIYEHCGIDPSRRKDASVALSRLNIQNYTWQRMRTELRSPAVGLSATSIDELQRFDFRDSPERAFSHLKMLFGREKYKRVSSTVAHLREVIEYAKLFGVSAKIYINPLNSIKENLYLGGILFSCLYDKSLKDVFAAGGRYDRLIKEQRPKIGDGSDERHAVGFNLSWGRLAKRMPKPRDKPSLKKSEDDTSSAFSARRCDALVASFDTAILRSTGIEILQSLWAHDISAELADDARSPEDLFSKHKDETYLWVIVIKQDSMLKIKTMGRDDVADVDIPRAQLVSWLRPQMRERDPKSAMKPRGSASSQAEPTASSGERDHEQDVKVLVAQTRSKKFNRRMIVEQAQASAANLMRSFLDGPVLAIETTDQVMGLVRETSMSDHESWRKLEQAVTTSEKKYVRELHDQLDTWRSAHKEQGGTRHSFIYNFRTGTSLYYDLGN